jgi:hypothetical protein
VLLVRKAVYFFQCKIMYLFDKIIIFSPILESNKAGVHLKQ